MAAIQLSRYPASPAPSRRRAGLLCLLFFLLISGRAVSVFTGEGFFLRPELIDEAEQQFGSDAGKRLRAWEKLIQQKQTGTEQEQLEAVNRFINRISFLDDRIHWKSKDYWATPLEFIASNGGDCEDFALAKYFTLRLLGMQDDKLTLTYVKAVPQNQAHMVLTYASNPGEEPLILDNLVPDIRRSSARSDLMPVYSFNGSSLWLAKQRGRGQMIGKAEQFQAWRGLMDRMNAAMEPSDAK